MLSSYVIKVLATLNMSIYFCVFMEMHLYLTVASAITVYTEELPTVIGILSGLAIFYYFFWARVT